MEVIEKEINMDQGRENSSNRQEVEQQIQILQLNVMFCTNEPALEYLELGNDFQIQGKLHTFCNLSIYDSLG